jgi:DNA-binding GntR family transcriptional regulator
MSAATALDVASSSTQADQAFQLIRAEILSCRLIPGAKIKINEITARFGINLGAVREALSRLSAEGMVIAEVQKGYRVAPVSIDELIDLTKTRIMIEQTCLRAAIEKGDVEWETKVVAAFHRLHRLSESAPGDPRLPNEAWLSAHAVFHAALANGCDSRWLLRLREILYVQTERYRCLSLPLRKMDRDVDAEHKGITDAALARDADKACELIADHLAKTTDILVTSPELAGQSAGGG